MLTEVLVAPEILERLRHWAAAESVAFGHQDATLYGVGWQGELDRSDVKSLTGSHPLVLGVDLGKIGNPDNLDGVPFARMRQRMLETHLRGGAVTASFHMENPLSGGDCWDTTATVGRLLPGGSHHPAFLSTLGLLAHFFRSLRLEDGTLVPVLFRPFHEHNGGWFWWGRGHASEAEYIELFRFTTLWLRANAPGQLAFAFSPGGAGVSAVADYLYAYPGDDVVDLCGLDHYFADDARGLVTAVRATVQAAESRGKLAALTEVGILGSLGAPACDATAWFTNKLLRPLEETPEARRLAYLLAWRNASVEHCFVPYPGHALAADFSDFHKSPFIRKQARFG